MIYSPLRYPGGKSKITPLIRNIIRSLNYKDITYIEPFAGGAGVGLSLLLNNDVNKIIINDYDKAIYSFWRALKESTDKLVYLIEHTPINIDEWKNQKNIYSTKNNRYSVELGFSAFYLNRTNRSGILNAGPIGGYQQNGKYSINARYNKEKLIERIQRIAQHKSKIEIYNQEIRSFIKDIISLNEINSFVYFDPPYYKNGQKLYKNFLIDSDHKEIAQAIKNTVHCPWIITYDDVEEVKKIYQEYSCYSYNINYSAANKGKGKEIMILKDRKLLINIYEQEKCFKKYHLCEI